MEPKERKLTLEKEKKRGRGERSQRRDKWKRREN